MVRVELAVLLGGRCLRYWLNVDKVTHLSVKIMKIRLQCVLVVHVILGYVCDSQRRVLIRVIDNLVLA